MPLSRQTKTHRIKGVRIEYLEIGKGKPLIFLHGAPVSFRFYKRLVEKFATKYTVYAPVLPGMGKSQSAGKKLTFDTYCKVIEKFIEIQNIDPVLLGHSLGGAVLAKVTADNPDIASSLILVDCVGTPFNNSTSKITKGWAMGGLREYLRNCVKKKEAQLIPWEILTMIFTKPNELLRIIKVVGNIDLRDTFKKIKVPTLLLWGQKDPLIPLDRGEEIHNLIPDSKLIVIKDGAHNWLTYDPDKCFEIVDKFVTRG